MTVPPVTLTPSHPASPVRIATCGQAQPGVGARVAQPRTDERSGRRTGIREVDAERIFGRFERAESARNDGGLGLGLFIVRQIVEAHGGEIRVAAIAGPGAEIVVSLPLSVGAPDHRAAAG